MKPPKGLSAASQRYLLGAVFTTGAVTLVLELVGARLISPYYGSSLYTWSAMITVTLVGLATGYHWGGRAADRYPHLTFFSRLICAAAAAVVLMPALRVPVLELTRPLGVQFGSLAAATLLVAPALVLLSALGPIAIRLKAEAVASAGRNAGEVYAVSTVGSVLGVLLAGFVLIPNLPLSRILYGCACLLLLLGALGAYLSALRVPLLQLAAAAAVALFGFWPRAEPATNLLHVKESPYGQIKVLDFGSRRYLLVNGTTQSMAYTYDLTSTDSQYLHGLEWAMVTAPPERRRRALVIGLGAGLLPATLERAYGATADSVEIDPDMEHAARHYFGFSPNGEVHIEDGRTFLERSGPHYDAIFLDAFGSESPPYHLFTAEAFAAARRRLNPGGVFAVNLVTRLHAERAPWHSAYKTLAAVFPEVLAFQASEASADLANVLLFASDAPLEAPAAALARVRPEARNDLASMLNRPLALSPARLATVRVMTDDYAPMEFLMADTAAVWRRHLQERIASVLTH